MPYFTRSIAEANKKANILSSSQKHPSNTNSYRYVRNSDNTIVAKVPYYDGAKKRRAVKQIFSSTSSMVFIPEK